MASRRDFSSISPLGSYAAKWCPVRIQLDVLQPGEPAPPAPDVRLRMDQGIAYEEKIVAQLAEVAGSDWVFIDETLPSDVCRAATVDAIAARVPVIVGANLPPDQEEKRSGKPDMLVWHRDGYLPVDIKHHMTLSPIERGEPALVSDIGAPAFAAAAPREGWELRADKGDALQLAHYRRMLLGCGAASQEAAGGIIGKEGVVVWYDLEAKMWTTPAKSDGVRRKARSTMTVYDFEFDFRRDIAAVATQHLADPDLALLVEPVSCGECATCPWRDICDVTLQAGSGDASLLPMVSYHPWRALRQAGIHDRAAVAALDLVTAGLVQAKVEAGRWLHEASQVDPAVAIEELRPRATKQIEALHSAGIHTAGDAVSLLDQTTAELGSFAGEAILNARAAIGPEPVYRRPGATVDVPRADIEIDVDMENTNDGVYLWGAFVSDRAGSGLVDAGYRAFISWDPITPEVECAVFDEFWAWLTDVRTQAEESGLSVKAYCWHETAEITQMRRIAASEPATDAAVRAFVESEDWVDMLKVFRAGWITGGSTGLKLVAPLAGFQWTVEDPGGGISMLHHANATESGNPEGPASREWLLEYNRGDVEATLQIRNWLEAAGPSLPQVA